MREDGRIAVSRWTGLMDFHEPIELEPIFGTNGWHCANLRPDPEPRGFMSDPAYRHRELLWAAQEGFTELAEALISKGADINAKQPFSFLFPRDVGAHIDVTDLRRTIENFGNRHEKVNRDVGDFNRRSRKK